MDYGIKETNPVTREYHEERHKNGPLRRVDWTEKGLRITRLRLLSDPGFPFWDVSYCHGILDGEHVDVQLPFDQLPKRAVSKTIVEHAKRDGVYARGIGILDNISTLI